MANNRASFVTSSNNNPKTPWLNNAMKSVGLASKDAVKDIMPNVSDAVETIAGSTKAVIDMIRTARQSNTRLSTVIRRNKYIKLFDDSIKTAIEDLKSGNFYNQDRAMAAYSGSSDDSSDNDGITFGDDGAGSSQTTASPTESAMMKVSDQIAAGTSAQIKVQQANMNAMIAMNATSMQQTQQHMGQILSSLTNINNNLTALVQYNNENLNKYINASLAYYEATGAAITKSDTKKSDKVTLKDVLRNENGGLDFSAYKKYAKQQFKDSLEKTKLGAVLPFLQDENMIKALFADPLGMTTKLLIPTILPKVVGTTFKTIDDTFASFVPTLLTRIGKLSETTGTTLMDSIKRMIGGTFGIHDVEVKKFSKTQVERGSIPFDGETKHAITEVITKELRDQTGYLQIIAKNFNKNAKKIVRENGEIWSYRDSEYYKQGDIDKRIAEEIHKTVIESYEKTKFGQSLFGLANSQNDEKEQQELTSIIKELLFKAQKNKKTISLDVLLDLLKECKGNKAAHKLISDYITDMFNNDQGTARTADFGRQFGDRNVNTRIKEMMEDSDYRTNFSSYVGDIDVLAHSEEILNKSNRKRKKFKGKFEDSKNYEQISKEMKQKQLDEISSNFGGFYEKFGLDRTRFGQMLEDSVKKMGDSVVGVMNGFMNRDASAVLQEFGNGMKEVGSKVKRFLFGEKDDEGEYKNGVLSEVINNTKTQFKNIFTTVQDGLMSKILGKKKNDEGKYVDDEELHGGLLGGLSGLIKQGISGWTNHFFGKKDGELTEDEEREAHEKIKEYLKKAAPNAILGSAAGAGLGIFTGGSLLGMFVGGPLIGAGLGAAVGLMSKTEGFQKILFGEEVEKTDENGNVYKTRMGGIISKRVQDWFHDNKDFAVGSMAVGGITGTITGGGILGTLVGGPIAGAILGLAGAVATKSGIFTKFLYGDGEQKGLINGIKDAWAKSMGNGDNENTSLLQDGMKSIGMMATGTAAGGLLGTLLGGPVVGAVAGLALSIKGQSTNLKEWFFGKEDGLTYLDDNGDLKTAKKQGVLGVIGNALKANIIEPMKTELVYIGKDFLSTLQHKLLTPISLIGEYVAGKAGEIVHDISEGVKGVVGKIGGIFSSAAKALLDPVTKAVGGVVTTVTDATWKVSKAILKTPGMLIESFLGAAGIKEWFNKLKPVKFIKALGSTILDTVKSGINGLFTMIGKVIAAPFKLLGGAVKGTVKVLGDVGKAVGSAAGGALNKLGFGEAVNKFKYLWATRDYQSSQEVDENGNPVYSIFDRMRLNKQHYEEEQKEIKANRDANRVHDKNVKIIQKYTKGQFAEDTNEARMYLKRMNPSKYNELEGKSIDDESREVGKDWDKIGNFDETKLTPEMLTAKYMKMLYEAVTGAKETIFGGRTKGTATEISDAVRDKWKNASREEILDGLLDNHIKFNPGDMADTEDMRELLMQYESGMSVEKNNIIGNTINKIARKAGNTIEGIKDRFSGLGGRGTIRLGGRGRKLGGRGYVETALKSAGSIAGGALKDGASWVINKAAPTIGSAAGNIFKGLSSNFGKDFQQLVNMLGVTAAGAMLLSHTGLKFKPKKGDKPAGTESSEGSMASTIGSTIGGSDEETAEEQALDEKELEKTDAEIRDADRDINRATTDKERNAALVRKNEAVEEQKAQLAQEGYEKAHDKAITYDELMQRNEARKQAKLEEIRHKELIEATRANAETTESFRGDWGKTFSMKDGLITGALIAALPAIIKLLGGFFGSLFGGGSNDENSNDENSNEEKIDKTSGSLNSDQQLEWTDKYRARTNGNTQWEEVKRNGSELLSGNLAALDRDGNATFQTSSRFGFLSKMAVNSVLGTPLGPSVKNVSKIIRGAGRAVSKGANFLANKVTFGLWGKAGNLAKTGMQKAGSSAVVQNAKNSFSQVLKNGIEKAVNGFKTAIEKLLSKLSGKTVNLKGPSAILAFVKNNWDDFCKAAAQKLSGGKLVGKGLTTAAKFVGYLITDAVFMTLGAINEGSDAGTAKLFHVSQDDIDENMRAIAAIFGAIRNENIISWIDLAISIGSSMSGVDFLHDCAVECYKFLVGNDIESLEKLSKAKSKMKEAWFEDKEKDIKEQYDLMKSGGILPKDLSYDDFAKGVEKGDYHAVYKSELDFYAQSNKTFADNLAESIFNPLRDAVKWGKENIWQSFFGGHETLSDDNGNIYEDNGDGTYKMTTASGETGTITADVLPNQLKSVKNTGFINNIFGADPEIVRYRNSDGTYTNTKSGASSPNSVLEGATSYGMSDSQLAKLDPSQLSDSARQTQTLNEIRDGIFQLVGDDGSTYYYDETSGEYYDDDWSDYQAQEAGLGGRGRLRRRRRLGRGGRGRRFFRSGRGFRRGGRGPEEWLNGASYFSQNDPDWKYDAYGNDGATMGDSGCGPTAMAMAINTAKARGGRGVTPEMMAGLAESTGYRDGTGTNADYISASANMMGMNSDEVMMPDGNDLASQLSSGNPVVLLGHTGRGGRGRKGGKGDNPFTSEGHYVVATGMDDAGNVMINDPRGKQYSGSYNIDDVANMTDSSWSISDGGFGQRSVKFTHDGKGGRGNDINKWLNICKAVKQAFASSGTEYNQGGSINITIGGKTLNARPDCSGFVSACLAYYGVIGNSVKLNTAALINPNNSIMTKTGFTAKEFTGWNSCRPGDILVRSGHTCIFAGMNNGAPYVFNAGSTKAIQNPNATPNGSKGYSLIWTPGSAGSISVNNYDVKGNKKTVKENKVSKNNKNGSSNDVNIIFSEEQTPAADETFFGKLGKVITNAYSSALDGAVRATAGRGGRGIRLGGRGRRLGGRGSGYDWKFDVTDDTITATSPQYDSPFTISNKTGNGTIFFSPEAVEKFAKDQSHNPSFMSSADLNEFNRTFDNLNVKVLGKEGTFEPAAPLNPVDVAGNLASSLDPNWSTGVVSAATGMSPWLPYEIEAVKNGTNAALEGAADLYVNHPDWLVSGMTAATGMSPLLPYEIAAVQNGANALKKYSTVRDDQKINWRVVQLPNGNYAIYDVNDIETEYISVNKSVGTLEEIKRRLNIRTGNSSDDVRKAIGEGTYPIRITSDMRQRFDSLLANAEDPVDIAEKQRNAAKQDKTRGTREDVNIDKNNYNWVAVELENGNFVVYDKSGTSDRQIVIQHQISGGFAKLSEVKKALTQRKSNSFRDVRAVFDGKVSKSKIKSQKLTKQMRKTLEDMVIDRDAKDSKEYNEKKEKEKQEEHDKHMKSLTKGNVNWTAGQLKTGNYVVYDSFGSNKKVFYIDKNAYESLADVKKLLQSRPGNSESDIERMFFGNINTRRVTTIKDEDLLHGDNGTLNMSSPDASLYNKKPDTKWVFERYGSNYVITDKSGLYKSMITVNGHNIKHESTIAELQEIINNVEPIYRATDNKVLVTPENVLKRLKKSDYVDSARLLNTIPKDVQKALKNIGKSKYRDKVPHYRATLLTSGDYLIKDDNNIYKEYIKIPKSAYESLDDLNKDMPSNSEGMTMADLLNVFKKKGGAFLPSHLRKYADQMIYTEGSNTTFADRDHMDKTGVDHAYENAIVDKVTGKNIHDNPHWFSKNESYDGRDTFFIEDSNGYYDAKFRVTNKDAYGDKMFETAAQLDAAFKDRANNENILNEANEEYMKEMIRTMFGDFSDDGARAEIVQGSSFKKENTTEGKSLKVYYDKFGNYYKANSDGSYTYYNLSSNTTRSADKAAVNKLIKQGKAANYAYTDGNNIYLEPMRSVGGKYTYVYNNKGILVKKLDRDTVNEMHRSGQIRKYQGDKKVESKVNYANAAPEKLKEEKELKNYIEKATKVAGSSWISVVRFVKRELAKRTDSSQNTSAMKGDPRYSAGKGGRGRRKLGGRAGTTQEDVKKSNEEKFDKASVDKMVLSSNNGRNTTYDKSKGNLAFISAAIALYSGNSKGSQPPSTAFKTENTSEGLGEYGFNAVKWNGWNSLVEGDILVDSSGGHACVFAYSKGNKNMVYTCDGDNINRAGSTESSLSEYKYVWRPKSSGKASIDSADMPTESAISNLVNPGSFDSGSFNTGGDISNKSSDQSASIDDGTSDSSSTPSGDNGMSLWERLIGFIGGFMSGAVNALGEHLATGKSSDKWFKNLLAEYGPGGSSDTSNDATVKGTSSSSVSEEQENAFGELPSEQENDIIEAADINPSDAAGSIWKYLKSKGLSNGAIAGIMGNMQSESGLVPGNLNNDANKALGVNDEEYVRKVDSGEYDGSERGAFGLIQWLAGRKKNLFNSAKSSGKSVGSLDAQLDFLWQELNGSENATLKALQSNPDLTPAEAAEIFYRKCERPGAEDTSLTARQANAKGFYNQYANGGSTSSSNDLLENRKPKNIEEALNMYADYKNTYGEDDPRTQEAKQYYDDFNQGNGGRGDAMSKLKRMNKRGGRGTKIGTRNVFLGGRAGGNPYEKHESNNVAILRKNRTSGDIKSGSSVPSSNDFIQVSNSSTDRELIYNMISILSSIATSNIDSAKKLDYLNDIYDILGPSTKEGTIANSVFKSSENLSSLSKLSDKKSTKGSESSGSSSKKEGSGGRGRRGGRGSREDWEPTYYWHKDKSDTSTNLHNSFFDNQSGAEMLARRIASGSGM